MKRPNAIKLYNKQNLKLRTKTSLNNIKSVLALVIMLYISEKQPSKIAYSEGFNEENDNETVHKIKINENVFSNLYSTNEELLRELQISEEYFKDHVNNNRLLTIQKEPLSLPLSLVWKLCNIKFSDSSLTAASERKKGIRFEKIIEYTTNLDIIYQFYIHNEKEVSKVLLEWIGLEIDIDEEVTIEKSILTLLGIFSETAIIRSRMDEEELIFNFSSLYEVLLEDAELVDIKDYTEATGPLRIIKSALSESMHPYLKLSGSDGVVINDGLKDTLREYAKRVDKTHKLNSIDLSDMRDRLLIRDSDNGHGINKLYYGAPGTGKSYSISKFIQKNGLTEYDESSDWDNVFRITLHPEYTYSDFIGHIMPVTEKSEGENIISYKFNPGPFTKVLDYAYKNPDISVFFILEELSRANVASVFGDVFQLLDRDLNGVSEYAINNAFISDYLFKNSSSDIRIPKNLFLLGTVNTSDQNVFVMDTAFKRRFEFEYVDANDLAYDESGNVLNDYSFSLNYKGRKIDFNWLNLYQSLNHFIVSKDNGLGLAEDKQLGQFFVKFKNNNEGYNYKQILNKILEYLWNDVQLSSFSDNNIFMDKIDSYSKLYSTAKNKDNFFSETFLMQYNQYLSSDANNEK